MIELVVADDLKPPLACPECGSIYVRCSLKINSNPAFCQYCGDTIQLTSLARPLPETYIVKDGQGTSLHIPFRARWAILLSFFSGVLALTATLADLGEAIGIHPLARDGPVEEYGASLTVLVVALAIVFGVCLTIWRLGKFSVEFHDGVGTISTGVGPFSRRTVFLLSQINGVCLVRTEDNDGEKHVIRLEGVHFFQEFGESLPDDQRAFVAMFILENRLRIMG